MNPLLICYLLAVHWVADFVLQTDEMALKKSTSNRWLTDHVAVYTCALAFLTLSPWFALINGFLHWGTDYVTSRWTTRLWKAERRHDFFVAIGVDQLVHTTTLVLTAYWFL
jgi:hypothetical protein